MYVDEIDFEAVTIEKIVDLVLTEMIHNRMQLEKEELTKQDQTDGNRRSRFKKRSEVLNHEEVFCLNNVRLKTIELLDTYYEKRQLGK